MIDVSTREIPWPGRFHEVPLAGTHRDRAVPESAGRTVRLNLRHTPSVPGAQRVFAVHGLGGSSTNFTDLATALSDRLRTDAIDLMGYGVSDPAPRGDYSIGNQAACVIGAIEASGDTPVHLVGNSMGGLISVSVAAARPDLVRTLTLISPAMPTYSFGTGLDPRVLAFAVPGLAGLIQQQIALGDPFDRALMTLQLCFADPARAPRYRIEQAAREVFVRQHYPWSARTFIASVRAIANAMYTPRRLTPWRAAKSLRVPTLIVWGDTDRLMPVRLAPRLAATIPGSRLLVLPGVGHTAQLEAPETTARAILGLVDS